jgi:hypothetical protein
MKSWIINSNEYKNFINKFIFHYISQFMVLKVFQNCLPLYQWHHPTFYVKKYHSTKYFNKYNESIIIWYGLWCKVFGISKVQYVMIILNFFLKFTQCDHFTYNIILKILFTYYSFIFCSMAHYWHEMVMYSTLVCFHPKCKVQTLDCAIAFANPNC